MPSTSEMVNGVRLNVTSSGADNLNSLGADVNETEEGLFMRALCVLLAPAAAYAVCHLASWR
eukprot:5232561-Amphidinium_carterae.1